MLGSSPVGNLGALGEIQEPYCEMGCYNSFSIQAIALKGTRGSDEIIISQLLTYLS
jgi:hypothetical protein